MSVPAASHPWKSFGKKKVKYSSRAVAGDSLCVFSFVSRSRMHSVSFGPLSEPKREALFIYFQFRKTKPELQVLCYSLSTIIIIAVIIIIIKK